MLRPAAPADLDAVHALVIQPGVRRYLFDDEIWPRDRVAGMLAQNAALFAERGFGLWLAHAKDDGRLVGLGGFWYFFDPPDLQLIYAIADEFTGRGYGRELARACVAFGFETMELAAIRACTDPPNVASQRLLEALGFTREHRATIDGRDTLFYSSRRTTTGSTRVAR